LYNNRLNYQSNNKSGRKGQRKEEKGKPLHYISSDGYDMYVGKNNIQNDELTFKIAGPNDMWFHAKKAPGSHVIVRRNKDEEIPDATYLEAARLAAFYSSVESAKVEIDYTERKNLKKPPQAKPGYVIYHTNYSMMAEPKKTGVQQVDDQ
jgi:predicted ribosome quality control (RQC) complex YloA/Tae2 family protein